MKTNRKAFLSGVFLLLAGVMLHAQADSRPDFTREYRFLLGSPDELELIATAGVSLNKVFQDIYLLGIGPFMPKMLERFAATAWGVFWTFNFALWPHEFGHWARTEQAGGDFAFTGFRFPFPVGQIEFPSSVTIEKETLASVGGFEVNNLMARQTHLDFYRNNFARGIELIHAFIQEIYFPLYAFLITPRDPAMPETWTSPEGDPVDFTRSVYMNYSGRPVLQGDGSVDPELISFYQEAVYASLLCILLDPMFYRSAAAFAVDMNENHGLMTPWMIGDERIAWIWGTQFNPSPLGYELYLTQYLRLHQKLYALYVREGRPFLDRGFGFSAPDIFSDERFNIGGGFDLWKQDLFGWGGSVSLNANYRFSNGFGLSLASSWKSTGYLMGRRLEEGFLFLGGLTYRF